MRRANVLGLPARYQIDQTQDLMGINVPTVNRVLAKGFRQTLPQSLHNGCSVRVHGLAQTARVST